MVSLFDMIALWILVGIPVAVGIFVAKHDGRWVGFCAGLLSTIVCVTIVVISYRIRWRRNAQHRREWKKKYSGIYCVIALPTDAAIIKMPEGAEIRPGDYGWEAVPLRDDGMIYLQGLTPEWRVVWHAGFRPDQVRRVAVKPQSQYDWDNTWVKNAPPCPYPVQERETTNMGLPIPH